MQDEPTEGRRPRDSDQTEMRLMMNLFEDPNPGPWSVRELALQMGDELGVDAVASLQGVGLLHRVGEFVFPTRAAAQMFAINDAS